MTEAERRAAVRAICLQQGAPECLCMRDDGIGFEHVPGALSCRDTYEEIWDALQPVIASREAAAADKRQAEIVAWLRGLDLFESRRLEKSLATAIESGEFRR